MRFIGKLLFVSFLSLISLFSKAAEQIHHFHIQNGLTNNHITSLFQDSEGYLWIGTEDGLNRYDGYTNKMFRHDPVDSLSISGNIIQVVKEDESGNIWVGTKDGGLNIINSTNSTFKKIPFLKEENSKEVGEEIYGLLFLKSPLSSWVKTRSYLSEIVEKDGNFKIATSYGHYTNFFKAQENLTYPMLDGGNGFLYIGTKDGLIKFDKSERVFGRILGHKDGAVMNEVITSLVELNSQFFLVGTHSGLMLFDKTAQTFTKVGGNTANIESITTIQKRDANQYWIGSKSGLYVYHFDTNIISRDNNLLFETEITELLVDKAGLIWIGTRSNGLFCFDEKEKKFHTINSGVYNGALESNYITSVLLDGDNYWVGTRGKGLFALNLQTKDVQKFVVNEQLNKFGNDIVNCIYKDKQGVKWIGTNSGLYVIKTEKNRIESFVQIANPTISNLLQNTQIYSIVGNLKGAIWCGTQFGLYKINSDEVVGFFPQPVSKLNSINAEEVYSLYIDDKQRVWIGSKKGVSIYDEKTKQISNWQHNKELLNQNILSIAMSKTDGSIWIGTRSGLYHFDGDEKFVRAYYQSDGLSNDLINSVLVDPKSGVWVGTNKGLSQIQNNQIYNYDLSDGLPSLELCRGAITKNQKGDIFIGSANGLVTFNPTSLTKNSYHPNIVITSVSVSSMPDRDFSFLKDSAQLELKYHSSMLIDVNFAAMDFTNPGRNYYKVFLENFDDNWSEESATPSVSYANLSPGEYNLYVMGSNNDRVWTEKPRVLKIVVVAPLWRTTLAYIFYVVALLFVIQFVINYRLRHYRLAYKSLSEKAQDKQRIEIQKEALTKINRSITDSINYAKRIQDAMLPSEKVIRTFLPNSFIYFRPKDIVSGDFYWILKKRQKIFVAAVDCTGHGVPGAFLSIIGYESLRNLIVVQGMEDPSLILDRLNREISETFGNSKQSDSIYNSDVKDGMDMALCVIDLKKQIMEFSGAMNPLYLVRDSEIISFEGDRVSIGKKLESNSYHHFGKREFPIKQGDVFYLFSDGYADQFGGPDDKKFKFRRLRHLLLNIYTLSFDDQKSILHQKMNEWMGKNEQVDDILVIGFKPI